jgi:fatty acid desaturase
VENQSTNGGRTVFPGSPALDALRSPDGRSWSEIRRSQTPRWGLVWTDLALRYLMLALGYAIACAIASRWGNAVGLLLAPLCGLWIGFWFSSIVLFMHEAAHYNLHRDKTKNDRLANAVVCLLVGDEIKHYRALHWKHHLYLGDTNDTEVSYHWAPSTRFFVETLLGVHALRVFKAHRDAGRGTSSAKVARGRDWMALARGLALHGVLFLGPIALGLWSVAAAWVFAVFLVFPFLSALRQQLEHRSPEASGRIDYSKVPHGAVNRMFGPSPLARAFGSVGFRRHLLHHWDPSTSYTRFDDLEQFLMSTEYAPMIDDARTTYLEVWRVLARKDPTGGPVPSSHRAEPDGAPLPGSLRSTALRADSDLGPGS